MSYNRMTSRDKIGICVRRMNSRRKKNEERTFQENEFCCSPFDLFFSISQKKKFREIGTESNEKYHIQPSQGLRKSAEEAYFTKKK